MNATTIGVDLSKSVFQLSLSNSAGQVVERKRLSRAQYERFLVQQPPAEIVMEACATAHHWARTARRYGHDPYLLHAQYVRPYVRRNKTDAADADALLRARRDPDLKPVAVKSTDQQALQGLHRIRQQWAATRRQRITLSRGLLAEFGISLPAGAAGIVRRLHAVVEGVPEVLLSALTPVVDEIGELEQRIKQLDRQLATIAKANPDIQRLMTIPGVGVIATAMLGSVADIHSFARARQFAAWLGLTVTARASPRCQRRSNPDSTTALGTRRRSAHPSQQSHHRARQQDGAHHLDHLDTTAKLHRTLNR